MSVKNHILCSATGGRKETRQGCQEQIQCLEIRAHYIPSPPVRTTSLFMVGPLFWAVICLTANEFLDTREWQSKLQVTWQAFDASVISVPEECKIIFGNLRV